MLSFYQHKGYGPQNLFCGPIRIHGTPTGNQARSQMLRFRGKYFLGGKIFVFTVVCITNLASSGKVSPVQAANPHATSISSTGNAEAIIQAKNAVVRWIFVLLLFITAAESYETNHFRYHCTDFPALKIQAASRR